jgi:fatty-acyl-CoA synthase
MPRFVNIDDRNAVEAEMPWQDVDRAVTIYDFVARAAARHGARPAISFQITAGMKDPAKTLSWDGLKRRVTQAANMFRALGIGPKDTVAYVLPNSLETAVTLLGGATAGIVNPVNPLLEPEQIAAILRETGAKVVVTLKAFPKADIAQRTAAAVAMAPNVQHVVEVDLNTYLTPPKSWIVPLIRPKNPVTHKAQVHDFAALCNAQASDALSFPDVQEDRVCAYFHTGGTTGMPKVAQHKYSGMVYNGWLGAKLLFAQEDVLICPLPLFHVFAAYPVLMSCIASGAHMVMPTPAGYRGEGVFDNFWKLIERWNVTFLIAVPTAISALMQRPVDADVSSLRTVMSGSAPLPMELYNRFKAATGVEIAEGYGLTEATCLVSCNPVDGQKKVGSVGLPLPHCHVRILRKTPEGFTECAVDEVGEICVANPGVFEGSTYTEADKNHDLFAEDRFLRTGDLGRLDPDGYLWITGRAKDLIIRGGHNIDPAEIEEALAGHPAVAFAGAIGQPDSFAGELPCAYVELVAGAEVTVEELMSYAREHIHERAALPKYIEVMDELPKTAVGKIFKPELRKMAIRRVFSDMFAKDGFDAQCVEIIECKRRGLVARISAGPDLDREALRIRMGEFTTKWEWVDQPES